MTYEYLNDTHMTYIYVSTYRGGDYWQYIVFFFLEGQSGKKPNTGTKPNTKNYQ